jgi:hypothetical protein
MTTFDDREKNFEAEFAHNEELRFKVHAHRNKLMALWVARLKGLNATEAEAYADAIVKDAVTHNEMYLVMTFMKDLAASGLIYTQQKITYQLDIFALESKKHVMTE